MMNNWKRVWNKHEIDADNDSILGRLIVVDGFDTGYGNISEIDWLDYVDYISTKLNLSINDKIYEVGCGAGAFLYPLYKKGHNVGGIDYSMSLINIAKEYFNEGDFIVSEASKINIDIKYDYVISNSVFFYFPNYEYAEEVINRMISKAIKGIAILEVNDLNLKEESMVIRKGYLSNKEYEKRYTSLEHLYYSKQWFINIAHKNNLRVEIEQQNINNYKNNIYRFNVFMYKD